MTVKLEYGRIVKAQVIDPQGHQTEPHFVAIITETSEITPGVPIIVVVITGTLPHRFIDTDEYVPLPYQTPPRLPHPETKLYKKCAAKCDWVVQVMEDHIVTFGGTVPPKHMRLIMEKINREFNKKAVN